jgi:hypothetical protein
MLNDENPHVLTCNIHAYVINIIITAYQYITTNISLIWVIVKNIVLKLINSILDNKTY